MSLAEQLPFESSVIHLSHDNVGLIIVDPGVGFTRSGNLADAERMVPMVQEIAKRVYSLSHALGDRLRILVFLDTHHPDIPEPPYPPHCVIGTGEELIDPDLDWLLERDDVTLIRKDCINGFVGAIDRTTGANGFCDWVTEHDLRQLLVCGDCTDICVSDFVVSALSARNHGLLTKADPDTERAAYIAAITGLQIVVLERACDTFHAPGIHDAPTAHHVGLWLMASRGATIASGWTI